MRFNVLILWYVLVSVYGIYRPVVKWIQAVNHATLGFILFAILYDITVLANGMNMIFKMAGLTS